MSERMVTSVEVDGFMAFQTLVYAISNPAISARSYELTIDRFADESGLVLLT